MSEDPSRRARVSGATQAESKLPGQSAGRRLICVDFDGTITTFDVLYTIICRYAEPGWQEFEDAWRAGKISSAECMRGELAKLHKSRQFLDEFFDQVPIDPGFPPFVERCQSGGFSILVMSDGLDYYIKRILSRTLGTDLEIISNRAWFEQGRLQLEPPYPVAVNDHAGNYKGHHIGELKKQYDHVTMIGDGLSDRGAAVAADQVYAKGELIKACSDRKIAHTPFKNFTDLLNYF